jgi:CRISPR-associated protein Cas1
VQFWFDDGLRLAAAKQLQLQRLNWLPAQWTTRALRDAGFEVPAEPLQALVAQFKPLVNNAPDVVTLLTDEARLTKALYKLAVQACGYGEFSRAKRGGGTDAANRFLDHGNYLAYGLGATATWVLGLPHGLAVLHGKTRRGGLVFDAADLVKDAIIVPQAFVSSMRGDEEQQFRRQCIESLTRSEALDFMIDQLKAIAIDTSRLAQQTTASPVGGGAE